MWEDREGVWGLGFNNNAVIGDCRLYKKHYYKSPWFPQLVETWILIRVTQIRLIDKRPFFRGKRAVSDGRKCWCLMQYYVIVELK